MLATFIEFGAFDVNNDPVQCKEYHTDQFILASMFAFGTEVHMKAYYAGNSCRS